MLLAPPLHPGLDSSGSKFGDEKCKYMKLKALKTLVCMLCLALVWVLLIDRPISVVGAEGGVQDARKIFVAQCARCHGRDGRGDTETGREKETPDISRGKVKNWSDSRLQRLISKGRDEMPAFENKLSPDEIQALITFVKGL